MVATRYRSTNLDLTISELSNLINALECRVLRSHYLSLLCSSIIFWSGLDPHCFFLIYFVPLIHLKHNKYIHHALEILLGRRWQTCLHFVGKYSIPNLVEPDLVAVQIIQLQINYYMPKRIY